LVNFYGRTTDFLHTIALGIITTVKIITKEYKGNYFHEAHNQGDGISMKARRKRPSTGKTNLFDLI
jgi:hypothetical protein